jgi:hypothetical protein
MKQRCALECLPKIQCFRSSRREKHIWRRKNADYGTYDNNDKSFGIYWLPERAFLGFVRNIWDLISWLKRFWNISAFSGFKAVENAFLCTRDDFNLTRHEGALETPPSALTEDLRAKESPSSNIQWNIHTIHWHTSFQSYCHGTSVSGLFQ